jgi:hypothetical protein
MQKQYYSELNKFNEEQYLFDFIREIDENFKNQSLKKLGEALMEDADYYFNKCSED